MHYYIVLYCDRLELYFYKKKFFTLFFDKGTTAEKVLISNE